MLVVREKRKRRKRAGLGEERERRSYSIIMWWRSSSLVTEIKASRSSPGSWYLKNVVVVVELEREESFAVRVGNLMWRSTARILVSPAT